MRTTLDRRVHQRYTAVIMALSLAPFATVYWLERLLDLPNAASSSLWLTIAAPVLVAAVLAARSALQRGGRPAAVLVQVHAFESRARRMHHRAA